jgi:uncharacterized membrane protein
VPMRETHARSFIKALSWRFSGSLITMIAVYCITKQVNFALYVGFLEFICKILFFYLHERLWGLIPFGIAKTGNE